MVIYRGLSVDATGIAQPRSRQRFTVIYCDFGKESKKLSNFAI